MYPFLDKKFEKRTVFTLLPLRWVKVNSLQNEIKRWRYASIKWVSELFFTVGICVQIKHYCKDVILYSHIESIVGLNKSISCELGAVNSKRRFWADFELNNGGILTDLLRLKKMQNFGTMCINNVPHMWCQTKQYLNICLLWTHEISLV